MPTRIPIYRDEIFKRLDEDKKEIKEKISKLNNKVGLLIRKFDEMTKLSKK